MSKPKKSLVLYNSLLQNLVQKCSVFVFNHIFFKYFRLVLKFFNTVLKDGKSSCKSKSTDSQGYAPISVSQNFHFVQPKVRYSTFIVIKKNS